MDYKRVLKLHFENGYCGRTIAKNTGEGQRTAINESLKRFKECEKLNWPLSEEVINEYIEALLYKQRFFLFLLKQIPAGIIELGEINAVFCFHPLPQFSIQLF